MPRVTFIHTADIHLDTPFKGLTRIDHVLARRLKQATFQAFHRVVDYCLAEPVDFLLIAGDTFDGEDRSLSAQLGFAEELNRLFQADIPVYMVFGNHDPGETWLKELSFPANVRCFGSDQPEAMTFSKKGEVLADIHGISFDSRSGGDNPTVHFQRKKAPAPFSIGLIHGTIGPPGPHTPYSPFAITDIVEKGFDYWALGHIHNRRIIREADPAIAYPGNPQGRDFGESGLKGCFRVTLEIGHKPAITFLPACTVRFETIPVDLTGVDTLERLPEKIEAAVYESGEDLAQVDCIARIILQGRTPLQAHFKNEDALKELTQWLNESLSPGMPFHIDRIENETLPDIDLDNIARGNDFPADVFRVLNTYGENPQAFDGLIRSMAETFASHAIRKQTRPLDETGCRQIMDLARRQLLDLFFK